MHRVLFVIFLGALSMALVGQTKARDAETIVRQALSQASRGTYTSTSQKELGRLGDASAVALTKIVRERALTESDIEAMLLIINLSYSDAHIVNVDSDRQPRTTLLLLRYLASATGDAKLKKKIEGTQSYVTEKYTNSLKQGDAQAQQPQR